MARASWILLLLIAALIFTLGCGGSDDNNDSGDDNDQPFGDDDTVDDDTTSDDDTVDDDDTADDDDAVEDPLCETPDHEPIALWPDDTGDVTGWVGAGRTEFDSFYQITADNYIDADPPDDTFFLASTMDEGVAFAATRSTSPILWELDENIWEPFPVQPPCNPFDTCVPGHYKPIDKMVRFADGTGYLVCMAHTLLFWDGSDWLEFTLPYPSADALYYGVDCLDKDDCVVWHMNGAFHFDGAKFTDLNLDCPVLMKYQRAGMLYQLSWSVCPDVAEEQGLDWLPQMELQVYKDCGWQPVTAFDGTVFEEDTTFAVIDERHLAFAYITDTEQKTVVIRDDDTVIDPDWPFFSGIAFAPNGSGIGYSDFDGIARLIGDTTELIIPGPLFGFPSLMIAGNPEQE